MERVAATVAIRCLHISAERQHLGSPKILAIACDMAVSYERDHSLARLIMTHFRHNPPDVNNHY